MLSLRLLTFPQAVRILIHSQHIFTAGFTLSFQICGKFNKPLCVCLYFQKCLSNNDNHVVKVHHNFFTASIWRVKKSELLRSASGWVLGLCSDQVLFYLIQFTYYPCWRYNFSKMGLCLCRSKTARRKPENQGMESTGKNRLFLLTQLNRRQLLNHLMCLTSLHEKAINNVRRGITFLHSACTMLCVENDMHKSPSMNKCFVRS